MNKAVDWFLWNKESKSIRGIGNEEDMRNQQKILNMHFQTDAFVAQKFVLNNKEKTDEQDQAARSQD